MVEEDQIGRLKSLLRQGAELLEGVGEEFWSAKLRQQLETSRLSPAAIVSWFGGMGSFNDLWILRANGHRVEQDQESAANAKLDELTSEIYRIAEELAR